MKIAILLLLFALPAFSIAQININADTLKLNSKTFNDPKSIKTLLDYTTVHKKDNPANAVTLSLFSYNAALRINNLPLQAKALQTTASIYQDMGQFQQAALYYQKTIDKIKANYIADINDDKNLLARKQSMIMHISIINRNKTIGIIIGLLLFFAFVGVLFYYRNKSPKYLR